MLEAAAAEALLQLRTAVTVDRTSTVPQPTPTPGMPSHPLMAAPHAWRGKQAANVKPSPSTHHQLATLSTMAPPAHATAASATQAAPICGGVSANVGITTLSNTDAVAVTAAKDASIKWAEQIRLSGVRKTGYHAAHLDGLPARVRGALLIAMQRRFAGTGKASSAESWERQDPISEEFCHSVCRHLAQARAAAH
eukprot:jgi/Tetstr1/422878/TSEL_013669.t1